MTTTQTQAIAVPGEDVRVGDVVLFGSTPHLVLLIEPYSHPTIVGCLGMAHAADGWSMSLWPGVIYEVARL